MRTIGSVKKQRPISPLGRRILGLIKNANFRFINEFERKTGVRKDSIRRLTSGYIQKLPIDDLQKVAKELKITVEELIGGSSIEDDIVVTSNLVAGSNNVSWYKIKTDEMHPTLSKGENVLVDVTINDVTDAGIYLIKFPNGTKSFRRFLYNSSGKLIVSVDNKAYMSGDEQKVNPKKISVCGRIIGKFQAI